MSRSRSKAGRGKAESRVVKVNVGTAKEPEPVQEPVTVLREVLTDLTIRRQTLDDIVATRWHPKELQLYRGGRPVGQRITVEHNNAGLKVDYP